MCGAFRQTARKFSFPSSLVLLIIKQVPCQMGQKKCLLVISWYCERECFETSFWKKGTVAKLHRLSGIIRKEQAYDVAFLRQREVFLQPVSVFAQRKRIVPDKGFYLTDIISEKTPFEGTALVGGEKHDAKMRHQKNPFCEKSILKMASTNWNYRKRHPIR